MTALLTPQQEATLIAALREQEARTSAEIRICISYKRIWRHHRFAWRLFEELGMRRTRHRNGVLLVVMPRMRRVVLIGDEGINAVLPPGFWEEAVAAITRRMAEAIPLEALLEGLSRLGDTLALHFPAESSDGNELPDDLLRR